MAADLFVWLGALYTKEKPEGTPPIFLMHRFMASDRTLAIAARCLQTDLKRAEPAITFAVWQALLPRGRAPRFAYIAPKKLPAAEALTKRMEQVLGERRVVVEEMQSIITQAGRESELYIHFGIEPPGTRKQTAPKKTKARPGGLLGNL